MKAMKNKSKSSMGSRKPVVLFFKRLLRSMSEMFQPEEVEVTFKGEGNHTTYTYTKVEHKQVA